MERIKKKCQPAFSIHGQQKAHAKIRKHTKPTSRKMSEKEAKVIVYEYIPTFFV